MKIIVSVLFYLALALIPISLIFIIQNLAGGHSIFALGLLGIFIYFTAKTIKDIDKKRQSLFNQVFQLVVISMSVVLFSKYLYHGFADYPGLIIVPIFIVTSVLYLLKPNSQYLKLTLTTIVFLLLSIPLFTFEFQYSPRHYIPMEWFNRYNVSDGKITKLSFAFKFKETEQLSIKAFELKKEKEYFKALTYYRDARKLEPRNLKLLFDMSETYAKANELETAISLLDTAIMINSSYAEFFNNRGLLYYKLNINDKAVENFKEAIKIDSTQSITYANLGLAYHSLNLRDLSCRAFNKAKRLGHDLSKYNLLINEVCN
jgi:hypothetical protein